MSQKNSFVQRFCIPVAIVAGFSSCAGPEASCNDLTDFSIVSEHIDSEKKAPCEITSGRCGTMTADNATIKYRGNSSARFPKHSYTVEFDEKKAFGRMQQSKHWVLNASYIDKSFMRHKLSFDLFRQMDPDNRAPHCQYVTVHENDSDQGLYILMERMDKQRLQLSENDAKAFISKEPPLFYTPDASQNRDSLYRASIEFPKLRDNKHPNTGLHYLEWLIFTADDATFRREIFRVIDRDNFIDWQLIILFTNNDDGQLKNYFIYRPNDNSRMRIALWDYDHTFGRTGNSGKPNMLVRRVDEKRNPLYRRLIDLNPDSFNERLSKRWKQLRKKVFTEKNIRRMIAENDRIVAPYVARNARIWPVDGAFYYDKSTYRDELKRIRTFVGKRLKQLDKRFR